MPTRALRPSVAEVAVIRTVIMPLFNGARDLGRSLPSLVQSTGAPWRLLAIDDGGTDDGPLILQRAAWDDERITLLETGGTERAVDRHAESAATGPLTSSAAPSKRMSVGPSIARNLGLAAADGDWIVYLDADDEFLPDYLATIERWANKADVLFFGYDFVEHGPPVPTDESDRDPSLPRGANAPRSPGVEPSPPGMVMASTETPDFGRRRSTQPKEWDPAPHAAEFFLKNLSVPLGVAHRRSLIDRVGGFDPLCWQAEDWDLWKRFARAGAEIVYVPAKSGVYHIHPNSRSRKPRLTEPQRLHYVRNRIARRAIYHPAPDSPILVSVPKPLPSNQAPSLAFCSRHSLLDPFSGAALATRRWVSLAGF
jgi:glycosyltransferase involved in cell wall biosynthesis